MAFKIKNPYWKSQIEKKAETHAPAVSAWLSANAENRLVGLAELRAGLPGIAGDLTRPVVNQICITLGLQVEGQEDTAA